MAATAKISAKLLITPVTGSETEGILGFTSATPPVEVAKGQPLVGTTEFSLDFGDIAAGSAYILWLYAITGNFYFKLGATTGKPILTDSHLYIPQGEAYPIPLNPNATAIPGVRGVSDSASGKLEYILVGK